MRLTEHWRLKSERYTLQQNNEVQTSGENTFPARPVMRREVTLYDFSGKQQDYAWDQEAVIYAEAER